MWTSQYDIIVETLTGSEFDVSVTDTDTVGYIKSRIQKYEGKLYMRIKNKKQKNIKPSFKVSALLMFYTEKI